MMATESTQRARGAQPGNKNGQKHGDCSRKRQLKERGLKAIKGSTSEGKRAKIEWREYALKRKGGESCPPDTREKIDAGTFYLWRALCLRSYIVDDAKRRGTPINRRRGTLPAINAQYDTAMEQWQRINDELQLKPKPRGNGKNPNLKELLEEIDDDG